MFSVIEYVDNLCCLGLQIEQSNLQILDAAICFYEMVSRLFERYAVPCLVLPSSGIVYRALGSGTGMAISRVCSTLCRSFKAIQDISTYNFPPEYGRHIGQVVRVQERRLQDYVLGIGGALWTLETFGGQGPNGAAIFHNFPASALDAAHLDEPEMALALTRHSALHEYKMAFCEQLKISSRTKSVEKVFTRKPKYEQLYLEFLRDSGLEGLHWFNQLFIRTD